MLSLVAMSVACCLTAGSVQVQGETSRRTNFTFSLRPAGRGESGLWLLLLLLLLYSAGGAGALDTRKTLLQDWWCWGWW